MARKKRTKEQNRRYQENRNRKAREEGFRSYSQKRRAKERFAQEPELRLNWQRQADDVPDLPLFPEDEPNLFSDWYRAMYDPTESKRRDRNSARAYWFVVVTGKVASFDDWEERYGPK